MPPDEPQVVAPPTGAVPLEQPAATPPVEAAPAAAEPVVAAAEAAPVAEAPVAAEAAPVEEKAATVAETPSLLEDPPADKPKEEAPAAETKPADGEKPADPPKEADAPKEGAEAAKPADAPKEADKPADQAAEAPKLAPIEWKYEMPEVVQMDDARRGEFHTALEEVRAGNPQKLVDLHLRAMDEFADKVGQDQHKQFNDTRKEWRKQITGDEEFGGAGFETSKGAIARMRNLLVSSHKPGTPEYDRQAKEANEFFRITGAGDHPVLWRILHNAARFLDEAPLPPGNISPAPGGKAPNGSRRSIMYDNPTSPNNRG